MPLEQRKAIAAILKAQGVKHRKDIDRQAANAKILEKGLKVPRGNAWLPIYPLAGIK